MELLVEDYFAAEGGAADDSTDCSAALQAAIEDAYTASGATIVFPSGICRLNIEVGRNFTGGEGTLHFKGYGDSAVRFMTEQYNRFNIYNLPLIGFSDLTFLGDPTGSGILPDASNRHFHLGAQVAWFERCQFLGLRLSGTNGAVWNVGLTVVRDCGMYGFSGAAAFEYNGGGLTLDNVECIDYGNYNGVYISKTPAGIGCWVLGRGIVSNDSRKQDRISIRGCSFDEGAYYAIDSDGVANILFEDSVVNVNPSGGGIRMVNGDALDIKRSRFGYTSTANSKAFIANNVERVIMNDSKIAAGVDKVELLGTTREAIFNNVKNDGSPFVLADVINTAGALLDFNGVRSRGALTQIG